MATYGPESLSASNDRRRPDTGVGLGNIHTATDGRDLLVNDPDGWEVEQPWLWWDGPAGSDGSGPLGPFGNPPPGAFNGPASWSALPVFMQCTSLIADQIAAMPWQVFRDGSKIDVPSWIVDPQAARLDGRVPVIDVPLVRMNQSEFWSQVIVSLLWWGEAFVYTPRSDAGDILAPLWLLHPEDVEVDGGRYYVSGGEDGREYLEEADLIVIRGHVRPGEQRGFGVLAAFREPLRLAAAVRGFALNVFKSGVPAGYLKVSQPDLTPERAKSLQRSWMASHGGVMKKIAVLNSVTEFHPLAIDPQTVALIDMLKVTAWEICTMFGVPTSKVGLSLADSMTYNNAQDDDARFVKDTLRVWVDRIETAISNRLPHGQYMRVNLNSYLRANTTERFASYGQALDPETGWMTVNEVRELEDLPRLDDPAADRRPGMTTGVVDDPSSDDIEEPAEEPAATTEGDPS